MQESPAGRLVASGVAVRGFTGSDVDIGWFVGYRGASMGAVCSAE